MAVLAAFAMMFAGTAGIAAQDATPAAAATFTDTMGLPELQLTVSDTAIEGVPAETAAGRYVVTLNVTAAEGGSVDFMQLPEGMTLDDFMALFSGPPPSPEGDAGTPAMEMEGSPPAEGEEGGPPDWYYTTKHAGGAAADPGQTAQVIIDLAPGTWIAWAGDPEASQPPVGLTVTGDEGATPTASEPTSDVTVTTFEYGFNVEGTLSAGSHVIKVTNVGAQPHFMEMLRSPVPITKEQVGELLALDMTGGTPAPDSNLPNPDDFTETAYMGTLSTGGVGWVPANLEPGYYVLLCFIPDIASGLPHAFEGMYEVFEVTG